ncbi:ribonuclease H1, putative [Trichophyton benhamiae CBS 112371]|uniref:ribonuclease H n=1 Tax=Arthroderma benhamiae (strain ATCC MYA-4681 / CBS 112371) TaxID=663331 RepID=D4AV90_ARTBC|nr:ribonuclease H1, putative [Trichophyton benhamiae CBS 112371]EFE33012.1 ribonuclease H1, putative [Trichophyton benhamiae CBS 112371]
MTLDNSPYYGLDGRPQGQRHGNTQPLVISVDGACRGNGREHRDASAGVFVDQGSRFNESIPLNLDNPSNQKAEILAGIHGLNKAREMDGGPSRHVTIRSDSEYMVKGVNEWSRRWESNGYRAANGQPVVNRELFQQLNSARDSLERSGIKVDFQHVPREENRDADHWASQAFDNYHNKSQDCGNYEFEEDCGPLGYQPEAYTNDEEDFEGPHTSPEAFIEPMGAQGFHETTGDFYCASYEGSYGDSLDDCYDDDYYNDAYDD